MLPTAKSVHKKAEGKLLYFLHDHGSHREKEQNICSDA